MTIISPGSTSRTHAGADRGEGGVLGGDHPAAVEAAEHQRPDALRVAGGVQRVLVHPDEAEGALQQRQHLERPLLERGVGVVGEQRGDQAGVVGRGLDGAGVQRRARRRGRAGRRPAAASSCGVDQVAVVAERDRAVGGRAERRLGVLPGARAGGRVAAVADREVALERRERRLVEDLRDQAHVLVDQDLAAVADRDAGRLLAAVLQRVEAEVGQLGDVLARGPDAEDAAGVLGALVVRIEGRGQPAVATLAGAGLEGHAPSLGRARGRAHSPCHRGDRAHGAGSRHRVA